MEYNHDEILYILSKNQELISVARKTIQSINRNIIISLNSLEREKNIHKSVIILDERHWDTIPEKENINTKLIVITREDSKSHTEELFKKGANDILYAPINYNLLSCLLKKYFGAIKIEDKSNYTYRGITIKNDNSITYNGCKIYLTKQEMSVFKSILLCQGAFKISSKALQVTVYRINKKTVATLGIRLIQNKYNEGYFITI